MVSGTDIWRFLVDLSTLRQGWPELPSLFALVVAWMLRKRPRVLLVLAAVALLVLLIVLGRGCPRPCCSGCSVVRLKADQDGSRAYVSGESDCQYVYVVARAPTLGARWVVADISPVQSAAPRWSARVLVDPAARTIEVRVFGSDRPNCYGPGDKLDGLPDCNPSERVEIGEVQ